MCTVTFVPLSNGVIITSSRDEQVSRPSAEPPDWYQHGPVQVLYPRDPMGGGTWIGLTSNGIVAVLLNGAFEKHLSQPPYRMSRGKLLTHLLSMPDPVERIRLSSLVGIEPFTLILYHGRELHVFRWDAIHLHEVRPDPAVPHIWSSATLYNAAMICEREKWFSDWLDVNDRRRPDELFRFHLEAGSGNPDYSVLMNRGGKLRTVSITGIYLCATNAEIRYRDILQQKECTACCPITGTLLGV